MRLSVSVFRKYCRPTRGRPLWDDLTDDYLDKEQFRDLFSLLQRSFPNVTILELYGGSSLPDEKKALLIGDYFSNLVELNLGKHRDVPLTFQTIGSRLKKLRILHVGLNRNDVPSPGEFLTKRACNQLGDAILDGLPSLEKLILFDWTARPGMRTGEFLESLVCALAGRPNLSWDMERGSIPKDHWNAMQGKGPIPFHVTMNQIKRRYGLQHTTDGQPSETWVEALIEAWHRFNRFDTFHAIFRQLPPMDWLSSMRRGDNGYLQISSEYTEEEKHHTRGHIESVERAKALEEKNQQLVERVKALEEENRQLTEALEEEKQSRVEENRQYTARIESLESEKQAAAPTNMVSKEEFYQLVDRVAVLEQQAKQAPEAST